MTPVAATPEEMVGLALAAARHGESELHAVLETLPAPIYTTDADGWVTFFNRACIDFAGRTPVVGEDRWCVTWKLYGEDGAFLPHEDCPMAVAIREKRAVRGAVAVAERPDGTRVMFTPYPTPLIDERRRDRRRGQHPDRRHRPSPGRRAARPGDALPPPRPFGHRPAGGRHPAADGRPNMTTRRGACATA